MPNTNTIAAASTGTVAGQNVIFSLKQGDLVKFQVAGSGNYLTPMGVIHDQLIIGLGTGGDNAIFQVVYTESDGDSVKVGLQGNESPFSWNTQGDPYLSNAIGLVSTQPPQAFILTAAQGPLSWVNIQAPKSPPPPYLGVLVDPATKISYLGYGFDGPTPQGTFELTIVG